MKVKYNNYPWVEVKKKTTNLRKLKKITRTHCLKAVTVSVNYPHSRTIFFLLFLFSFIRTLELHALFVSGKRRKNSIFYSWFGLYLLPVRKNWYLTVGMDWNLFIGQCCIKICGTWVVIKSFVNFIVEYMTRACMCRGARSRTSGEIEKTGIMKFSWLLEAHMLIHTYIYTKKNSIIQQKQFYVMNIIDTTHIANVCCLNERSCGFSFWKNHFKDV